MAEFKPGTEITTETATIEVTMTPAATLSVGTHRFQLVVIDDDGNESKPAIAEVLVKDIARPTAKLDIIPKEVEFGKNFTLSGRASVDIPPGKITKFIWTRLD